MPNGQPPKDKLEKVDAKEELEESRTKLHNLRFAVQVQEAIVKKLEELAR